MTSQILLAKSWLLGLIQANWVTEVTAFLKLAIPISITRVIKKITDFIEVTATIMLGGQAIAAGALGGIIYGIFMGLAFGFLSAVGAVAAIALGAQDPKKLQLTAAQGFWLAIAFSLIGTPLIYQVAPVLQTLGQNAEIVQLAQPYIRALALGFPAFVGFAVCRHLFAAVNQPKVITGIAIGGIVLILTGNYTFTFGHFGMPALGLLGAGISSAIVMWYQLLAALICAFWYPPLKRHELLKSWHHFDAGVMQEIFQLGWASGLIALLQNTCFMAITYLMGLLGVVPLAAYRTAKQIPFLTYQAASGIARATTIRVGQRFGEANFSGINQSGFVGNLLGVFLNLLVGIPVIFYRDRILYFYLNPQTDLDQQIYGLANSFLIIGVFFGLFNCLQTVLLGALQGLEDARVPMFIVLACYWLLGLGGGSYLAFVWHWGGVGLFVGLTLCMVVLSALLFWRWQHQLAQARGPAPDPDT